MLDIKKILVPTDFSENAAVAYQPALKLAKKYGAKIDLIHIIPTLHYFNDNLYTVNFYPEIEEDLYRKLNREASEAMEKLTKEYLEPEHQGNGIVEIASKPAKAMVEYAENNNYDLIFMAVQGKHNSEFLRGSTTKKVIRFSNVPVLTTGKSDLGNIRNVMVPTDGSRESFSAFPAAMSVALAFGSSITLYHVDETENMLEESAPENTDTSGFKEIRDVIFNRLKDYIDHGDAEITLEAEGGFESELIYKDGHKSTVIPLTLVVERGVSAHHAITQYATEHAGLVVMATHGLSGLAHLFLGSNTEKVVQHLKLPVITVKVDFQKIINAKN